VEIELTPTQARGVWGLRRRFPGADLVAHQRPWGVIVEVRRGGHTLALAAFDEAGAQWDDVSLRRTA
jgi:hypothetical protein